MNLILGVLFMVNIFLTSIHSDKLIARMENLAVSDVDEHKKIIRKLKNTFFILFATSLIITLLTIFKDLFF